MYSNVTPPTLPEYDAAANPYYVLVFNYETGAEDWYQVHLIYGAQEFQYSAGVGVTNPGTTYAKLYGTSGAWADDTLHSEDFALNPGQYSTMVYQRIYTNANIFNGDDLWLAADSVTPVEEEDPEAERMIRIKSQLAGIIAALCSPARVFPKREPVAFLYNGVRLLEVPDEIMAYRYVYLKHAMVTDVETYSAYGFDAQPTTVLFEHLYGSTEQVRVYSGTYSYAGLVPSDKNEWSIVTSKENATDNSLGYAGGSNLSQIFWSNFDIYALDGTVASEASEPVPVYE